MKAQSLHSGKSLPFIKSDPEDDFMWPPRRLISPLAKGEELTSWQGASGRPDGPRLMHLGRGRSQLPGGQIDATTMLSLWRSSSGPG